MAIYIQSVLNSIGYKATVKPLSSNISFTYMQNSKNKMQIGVTQWYQDYPQPSDFLNVLLGLRIVPSRQRHEHQHVGLLQQGRRRQDEEGAAARHRRTRRLRSSCGPRSTSRPRTTLRRPSLLNPRLIDFLSKRVGNYIWSAQFYMLLDQAWVQ